MCSRPAPSDRWITAVRAVFDLLFRFSRHFPTEGSTMPIGLSLSGGGARGDFQVGALRFLYDQGVRPDVVAGTSVGAINGAKLAEGESDDPTQGLRGLEAIWTSLRFNSDMYLYEPWLGEID